MLTCMARRWDVQERQSVGFSHTDPHALAYPCCRTSAGHKILSDWMHTYRRSRLALTVTSFTASIFPASPSASYTLESTQLPKGLIGSPRDLNHRMLASSCSANRTHDVRFDRIFRRGPPCHPLDARNTFLLTILNCRAKRRETDILQFAWAT